MTTTSTSELRMAINSNLELLTELTQLTPSDSASPSGSVSPSNRSDDEAVSSYAELCFSKMTDGDAKVRALLAMLIGLEYPELKVKFDEHVKEGRLTKSSIRLCGKIDIRYALLRY